jgi:hypothetical protein
VVYTIGYKRDLAAHYLRLAAATADDGNLMSLSCDLDDGRHPTNQRRGVEEYRNNIYDSKDEDDEEDDDDMKDDDDNEGGGGRQRRYGGVRQRYGAVSPVKATSHLFDDTSSIATYNLSQSAAFSPGSSRRLRGLERRLKSRVEPLPKSLQKWSQVCLKGMCALQYTCHLINLITSIVLKLFYSI